MDVLANLLMLQRSENKWTNSPVPVGTAAASPAAYGCFQGNSLELKAMANIITSKTVLAMNFAVGIAVISMLFPHFGKPCDKPAGVRTAIELLDKRGAKPACMAAIFALA
jgi:hypothetical protein